MFRSLRVWARGLAIFTVAVYSTVAVADTLSITGNLGSSTSALVQTFTVSVGGTVVIQTWGFGGGTNAQGQAINAGGFDPMVALYAGTGPGAIFIDGTSDIESNYYNSSLTGYSSLAGCGPAGFATINGTGGLCGDVRLAKTLSAGTYTLLLTDGSYIPVALDPGTPNTLGDVSDPSNFNDFTGGVFALCGYDPNNPADCATLTDGYAVDITTPDAPVPEPATLALVCTAGLIPCLRRRRKIAKPA